MRQVAHKFREGFKQCREGQHENLFYFLDEIINHQFRCVTMLVGIFPEQNQFTFQRLHTFISQIAKLQNCGVLFIFPHSFFTLLIFFFLETTELADCRIYL